MAIIPPYQNYPPYPTPSPVGAVNFGGKLGELAVKSPSTSPLPSPTPASSASAVGSGAIGSPTSNIPTPSQLSSLTNSSNFMQAGAAVGNMVSPGVGGLVGAGIGGAADLAMAAYQKARQEEMLDKQMAEARAVQIAQQRRADRQYADQQYASAIMRGDAKELEKYNKHKERSMTFKSIIQNIYAQRQATKAQV